MLGECPDCHSGVVAYGKQSWNEVRGVKSQSEPDHHSSLPLFSCLESYSTESYIKNCLSFASLLILLLQSKGLVFHTG